MYGILLSRGAEKVLAELLGNDIKKFRRILRALDAISEDPSAGKALVGNLKGYYSYRVGDYRIIYEIERKKLLVYVEKIEHRKNVYR